MDRADVLFLAVRPQIAEDVIPKLKFRKGRRSSASFRYRSFQASRLDHEE